MIDDAARNNLLKSFSHTIERQRALQVLLFEKLNLAPGPYSLFHHQGHVIERLEDVALIIERISAARARITGLNERLAKLEPKRGRKPGMPLPKKTQAVEVELHRLTRSLRVDVESLYIFANMVLDQWAYSIGYSLGLDSAGAQYSFHYLIMQLQSASPHEALRPLAEHHLQDALWLYYQLRFYRNNFIEHVSRPWQRGSAMSVYGNDFNFFIPSPPGWIPDEKAKELLGSVRDLAPAWLLSKPDDYWQKARPKALLEATFKEIDRIPRQADREKVWNVWKELGGSVVSYDELGRRLAKFMLESTDTVAQQVEANPEQINPGASPRTS